MSKSISLLAMVAGAGLVACSVVPESVPPAKAGAGIRSISNPPLTLTLGTATPGGGFPVYGEAFVATVHEADPTLTIDARNTKGSAENIPLLEQGKLDLALVQ